MTLATISRAPLIIPKSSARDRLTAAANALQRAIDDVYEEAKEQAREKARRQEEMERRARAYQIKAEARRSIPRIEVSKAWLERFATDALDAMRIQMAVARSEGQRAFTDQMYDRINSYCAELVKLGLMERAKP
jgi:hypothetical protein